MLTEEQRFIFDVQGYLVLPSVLPADQIKRMHEEMDRRDMNAPDNDPTKSRFGNFFGWGDDWRGLIDHPKVLPALEEMLGEKFRLDHAYGMMMSADGHRGGEGLHHYAGMFDHGCYYVTHRDRMHNGLLVVSYTLVDVSAGGGGFCCIPGSHKATFPVPKSWFGVDDNPLMIQPELKAGDVLIFTESLTHGTKAWTCKTHQRRAVLLKYTPAYMQWAPPMDPSHYPELTERQKLIVSPAYVWNRPALDFSKA